MKNLKEILGKKLVSEKEMIAYHRFPESDDITLIPAGKPSPEITSYLPKGFYQLEQNGANLYVLDSESVKVVEPDQEDQSTVLDQFKSAIGGLWFNVEKDIEANVGYLQEGATATFDQMKIDLFDIGKKAKQILLVAAVVFFLILISKIT